MTVSDHGGTHDPPGGDVRRAVYDSTRARVEALWEAAWAGNIEHVRKTLDDGYHDVNGPNRWGVDIDPKGWQRTPLHAAAIQGHAALAKYLLSERANVNSRTKYGDTPASFSGRERPRGCGSAAAGRGRRPEPQERRWRNAARSRDEARLARRAGGTDLERRGPGVKTRGCAADDPKERHVTYASRRAPVPEPLGDSASVAGSMTPTRDLAARRDTGARVMRGAIAPARMASVSRDRF